MPLSRLELVSSHGDQTLGNIRFAVHGSANGDEAAAILSSLFWSRSFWWGGSMGQRWVSW
jgi:hypothetical protein